MTNILSSGKTILPVFLNDIETFLYTFVVVASFFFCVCWSGSGWSNNRPKQKSKPDRTVNAGRRCAGLCANDIWNEELDNGHVDDDDNNYLDWFEGW